MTKTPAKKAGVGCVIFQQDLQLKLPCVFHTHKKRSSFLLSQFEGRRRENFEKRKGERSRVTLQGRWAPRATGNRWGYSKAASEPPGTRGRVPEAPVMLF